MGADSFRDSPFLFLQVLVELAQLQDEEVGDGTTSVVIIAAELLKNADELVKQKIHPTSIIAGYRLACKEAVRYVQVRFCGVMTAFPTRKYRVVCLSLRSILVTPWSPWARTA